MGAPEQSVVFLLEESVEEMYPGYRVDTPQYLYKQDIIIMSNLFSDKNLIHPG